MSFLDQLAFGPGGDKKAWARILLIAVAVLALAGGLLYTLVSGDYAYLRASVLTGAPTGGYNTVGQRLAALALKKNGHLKVVATAGSVENVARLVGEKGRCVPAFAFVQDGIPVPPTRASRPSGGCQPRVAVPVRQARPDDRRIQRPQGRLDRDRPGRLGHRLSHAATMENSDLSGLGLKPSNHNLEEQAGLVRDGQLDLAASVMNEKAELVRTLVNKYDLEIVAPTDIEGLISRNKWMHIGRIPAGFYDVAKPIPATDKLVAQVDTLVITNACVHRAERVAFLMLLAEEFPNFVHVNPPPAAKSQDNAPLADEAREFFASGQPELAEVFPPSRQPDVARLLDLSGDGGHRSVERHGRL